MARVHHVAHAQQRYATVPDIDPATGQQKVTLTSRTTKAKAGRASRPVSMRVTKRDLTRPLPPEKCDKCGKDILPGDPYKWIAPRSGPYGGRRMTRCASCPSWQVWEYSSSLNAQLAQVSSMFWNAVSSAETEDDVQAALDDAASAVEEIAEAKRESAQNIEDGFQHATEQSEELNQIADALENWAGDIRTASIPDYPEPEEGDCEACDGTGKVREPVNDEDPAAIEDCGDCGGDGQVTPDDPTEAQLDDWRAELESELSIVDEVPV